MNNLSWFIYLIQVVDSLRGFAGAAMAITAFIILLSIVFAPVILAMIDEGVSPVKPRTVVKAAIAVLVIAGLVHVAVPSRQTILLIAGSEMGERAIAPAGVQDVVNPGMDLVKLWIKQETDRLKKKAE